IGGSTPAARNVIVGTFVGVDIQNGTNTIQGNYIGANKTVTGGLASSATGVRLTGGASTLITGNAIAGNSIGVSSSVNGNNISQNVIGKSGVPNITDGVRIGGSNNTVFTNAISFNGGNGVAITSGAGNRILQNAIHDNTTLGVDLMTGTFGIGPTANDVGDVDTGGNGHQNFPTINGNAAVSASGTLTVNVTLDSPAGAVSNLVQYFEADGDPSFPEGKRYIDAFCFNSQDVTAQSYSMPGSLITPGMRVVVSATSFGSASCVGTALDGTSEFSPAALAVNQPPVVTGETLTTAEDTPLLAIPVLSNDTDPEADPLTISGFTQPPVGTGTVTCSPSTCDFTPALNYAGPSSFTYQVSDGVNPPVTGTVTITVTPVNDPPVAVADSPTTPEDIPLTFDPRINDTDVEGNPITINGSAGATNGTVSCTTTSCTFTPAANFSGTGSFTYTITDGAATSAPGTVTITITAVNDAPVTTADTITTAEDTPATIDQRTNDTDAESDPLTVTGASAATSGIVTFTATSVTYTPNLNFAGADSFTYSISDGVNPPVNGTVSVTVTPVNDPPTANPDSLLVTEDTPATVNVFANDTDPDGPSSPTITGTSGGTLGTVSCAPTGGCTYTPNANANGSDSFTYTVFDGVSSSIGTVTVTITAVNDAPVANPDSGTTTTGAPIAIIVTSNDTDIDGGPLTASVSTPPANGTVACAGTTCTYTSNAGFVGTDTFTYTVSDGNGGTASATVTINVITANAPPNANDDSATTQEGQPVRINVLANDSDPNGDPLTILSFTQGTKGTVNCVAGACTYTPNPGSTGSDSFTYTIKDPSNATDTATVFINIIPCPAAPTIQSPAAGATNVPTSGNLVFSSSARDHLVFFGPAGSGCSTEYYLVSNSVTAPYSGLQAGTEYEWRVEAREPGGPRVSSSCARFSTGGSCPAPPTAISPASGTSIASPVTFSWTAVSGATNYRVFISVNSAAATEIGSSTTTTLVTTVPDGAIAWHVVATVPGCGEIRSTPVTFNACNAPAQPLASVIA
ncbi:MAG TPA: Ig-like domain-containing protein, partial [Gemmatimonadaceae bacterium]|nr:Ig-like domain-containing protein [Gemmatimonadaceae bacterium]